LKTHYSNSRALVIGINEYINTSPLSYAVNDAKEIRSLLIDEMEFAPEKITYLIDKEATKQNILKSFLSYTYPAIDLDERIFIFFAGHGYTHTGIRGEVGYLVPHDAVSGDLSTWIRWNELTGNAELIRAKHMLFIMDACYSGLSLTRNMQQGSTRFLKDMMLRYSRQVITAGKADEVVADSGGPIPDHSVFTGHLIEGLKGKASTESGIITASGLMSYVYSKVANDKNSNQTPHYGYFDGDGDFIIKAPIMADLEDPKNYDNDRLMVVPYSTEEASYESTLTKIIKLKSLLSNESSFIELHDYCVAEVRKFLSATSDDVFKIDVQGSTEDILDRISKYEKVCIDLSTIIACLCYWGKQSHLGILQKVLSRSTDRIIPQGGLISLINLRWYPLIISMYCSGIASIEGKRYDSIHNMFSVNLGDTDSGDNEESFVEVISNRMLELNRCNVFKGIPGHENNYVPMSEYLFKIIQPMIDDVFFIGKGYEKCFDEFEILLALTVAGIKKNKEKHVWGPIGRFGWKHRSRSNSPYIRIVGEANNMKENWPPIKAGLFNGNYEQFRIIAEEYGNLLNGLPWY
jgi:hypothetical protein